jgi:hypothetical protein
MKGHYIDDKCGGVEWIPYRESEDEAYDRWRYTMQEEEAVKREAAAVMAMYREFTSVRSDRPKGLFPHHPSED